MAWQGEVNKNIEVSWVASVMFYTKKALLGAGWELMATGEGTGEWLGSPNEDGTPLQVDSLDSVASCDGLNVWFRIREPENPDSLRREFVFLKGSLPNALLIKYSRSSGFVEGGGVDTAPTTGEGGDGVVITGTTQVDSTSINYTSATSFNTQVNSANKINVVVSDTSIFGVFPFYIWTYRNGTGNCDSIFLHEAVLPGTTSSLDQDPTYRVLAAGDLALQFLRASSNATIGDYWEAYGLPNAVHHRGDLGYTSAYGSNYAASSNSTVLNIANASRIFPPVNILGPSPYSGQPITVPTLVGIGDQFPKGFSTGVMFGGFTAQNVLDTFNIGSLSPKIIAHYPNAREAIFLPWVPNVIPQV